MKTIVFLYEGREYTAKNSIKNCNTNIKCPRVKLKATGKIILKIIKFY